MTMRGPAKWRLLAAAGLMLAGAGTAGAQTQGPNGRVVYEAAYFKQFAPSNALQIVERTPGFQLDLGNTDVRGFGQAAGNVVINGQRPSSKAEPLDTVLARIPANRVARVEIGPGDVFGSEYAGKSQVLNLVLTSAGGLAGNVTGTVRRDFTGKLFPEGSASALLRRGPSTFNAAVAFNNNRTSEEGFDVLESLPYHQRLEYRRKVNRYADPNGAVSASWGYDGGANEKAHLNGRAAFDRLALTQYNDVFPEGGTVRDDRLTQRYRSHAYEIGGDFTRPFLGGGFKLIGLATRRHRYYHDLSLNRVQSNVVGGFAQDLDDERDETVLRGVWSRSNLLGWSVEAGAEGVLNSLRSDVNLYGIEAGGARTPIPLPIGHAVVTEHRGEAFVNAGRNLSKVLRLDLGVTYEASRLTVTGDATAERTLRFVKPKGSIDWHPAGGWHVQASIERTVAQLQFEDFISLAELTNDRVNGGNANLVPQRAWETRLTVEHPILGDGLVKVELGYDTISLVQDRIPTPQGFDAPGNLGSGSLFLFRTTVDAPLTRFGFKGGRFTTHTSLVSTSVEDPYTHRRRHFSGNGLFYWDANLRQDLGKFAWGVSVFGGTSNTFYRLNETDTNKNAGLYLTAFAEYRPSRKMTVTFGLDNAADTAAVRDRVFYFPDRSNPVPSLHEHRFRNRHVIPYLTLKYNFG
jgi:hypothetical protein